MQVERGFVGLLIHTPAGLPGFRVVAAYTGLGGLLGDRGRGKDAAVVVESPGRSCNSSRHLGRQIAKGKMKVAKPPVL